MDERLKAVGLFVVPAVATWLAFELFEPDTKDGIKLTASVVMGMLFGAGVPLYAAANRSINN